MPLPDFWENTNRVKAYPEMSAEMQEKTLDGMFEFGAIDSPLSRNPPLHHFQDEISDDASAGLMHVRRSMKVANDRIHTQLASLVNGSARNYLAGLRYHHAKRPLLYPGKSRIQRSGSRYDPRPVFHRLHLIH